MKDIIDRVVCSDCMTKERLETLMSGATPIDYEELKNIVRREMPSLYERLCLSFPNPYGTNSKQTKTHYILAHSMKQYFIKK